MKNEAPAAFVMGWLLGQGNTSPAPTQPGDGYTVTPTVTITGLMGTLDLTLNGVETKSLTANGTAGFTTSLADGSTYTLTATQRATFTIDATKRRWVSQTCTVDSGSTGTMSGSDAAPAVSVSCVNNPYIYDPDHNLSYKRCTQGQTYQAATNDCRGAGGSAPYGALTLQYCSANDNSCNDSLPDGENSVPVLGHLNGSGTSGIYSSCQALNSSGGYGKTGWRVPRISELRRIVDVAGTTGAVIDPLLFPDTVASIYWSASTYVPYPTNAWFVAFSVGDVSGYGKTNSRYVRCVSAGP